MYLVVLILKFTQRLAELHHERHSLTANNLQVLFQNCPW
jgi:hypothetical protein